LRCIEGLTFIQCYNQLQKCRAWRDTWTSWSNGISKYDEYLIMILCLMFILNLVSLARSHVICFVINNLHTTWCFWRLSSRARYFLMIGKHLYLQRYKKRRQELLNGKMTFMPVRPIWQTGQTDLSNQQAILRILEDQRLSTWSEYVSSLSNTFYLKPLV
jgi:hypothetical protein